MKIERNWTHAHTPTHVCLCVFMCVFGAYAPFSSPISFRIRSFRNPGTIHRSQSQYTSQWQFDSVNITQSIISARSNYSHRTTSSITWRVSRSCNTFYYIKTRCHCRRHEGRKKIKWNEICFPLFSLYVFDGYLYTFFYIKSFIINVRFKIHTHSHTQK